VVYYYGVDHGLDHYSASWGGFLLPAVVRHVGEAGAWAGREVLVVHQVQVDTEQACAGAAGASEVVVHLAAAVEVAPYVDGLTRARIQTLEA
jgi:hypothetical protein